jgi:hypothetical protein
VGREPTFLAFLSEKIQPYYIRETAKKNTETQTPPSEKINGGTSFLIIFIFSVLGLIFQLLSATAHND